MIVVHPVEKESRGIERDATGRILDSVWLVEAFPPYRKSTRAVRIRVWRWALHLGLCKVMDADDPLRPRDIVFTPEEIATEFRRFDYDLEEVEHDPAQEEEDWPHPAA